MTYYSFDPSGDGFRYHETEQEARAAAALALETEKCEAEEGGWSDDITHISWGVVRESAEPVAGDADDYELRG